MKKVEVTFEEDFEIYNYNMRVNPSTIAGSLRISPMIYEGTEEKSYEPYGASPSPKHISEIEAVGDNIQLFDKEDITQDCRLDANGENFASTGYFISNYIEIVQHKQLVVNYNVDTMHRICLYDKDKNLTRAITNSRIVDIENSDYYIRICGELSNIDTMKLEKGASSTVYSEFGQGSVKITNSNENMLSPVKKQTTVFNGVTYNSDGKGSIEIKGTPTASGAVTIELVRPVAINLYSLYIQLFNSKVESSVGVRFMDNSNRVIQLIPNALNKTEQISDVNLDKIVTITAIQFYQNNNALNLKISPTISANAISEFVEHKSETQIMPTQKPFYDGDTFVKIDNEDYEQHNSKELILNGNETVGMIYQTVTSNQYQTFSISKNDVFDTWSTNKYIACTHFQKILGDDAYNKRKIGICSDSSHLLFCTNILTVSEFKAWLKEQYEAGTPVKVVYRTKNTELIKCTDEQSKILDKINTYKNTTIITTDNDLAKIDLRYKLDVLKAIQNVQAMTTSNENIDDVVESEE